MTENNQIPQKIGDILTMNPLTGKQSEMMYKCHRCKKEFYNPIAVDEKNVCIFCREDELQAKKLPTAGPLGSFYKNFPPAFHAARMEQLPLPIQRKLTALEQSQGVYLWGPPGSGKSYTAAAFAYHLAANQGTHVSRVKSHMLTAEIRATFQAKAGESEADIIRKYATAQALFIEDVGAETADDKRESDFTYRVLFSILDERIEHLRPTFITSNKPLEIIEKTFDERIASRIAAACVIIKLIGQDRRKNNA